MRIRNTEQRMVRAGDLIPNARNWRTHPKPQREAMRAVLEEIGFVGGLLARLDATGRLVLIDGHLRAGIDPEAIVPVTVTDLTEQEANDLLTVYDPISAMAGSDQAALLSLLRESRFEAQSLRDLQEALANGEKSLMTNLAGEDPGPQMDRAEELRQKWGADLGQVWGLPSLNTPGKEHRLMCGDSTNADDVRRLMQGERACLMATDPPYGVDFEGAKYNPRAKAWAGIEGDKRQGGDLSLWLASCIEAWSPHIAEDAGFYFWTAAMDEGAAAAAAAIRSAGLHIQSQIIWNKNTLVLGQADYQWKHENCWYAFKKGAHHRWFGGRAQTTVWDIKKVANRAYEHPMQKPADLYTIPIENHTRPGEVCAEPFSGSGTQFAAAEQTGRLCYGMEIEPKYVAVALERMAGMGLSPRLV